MTATHVEPAHLARMLSRAGLYHLNANGLQTLCELSATGADSLTMTSLARKLEVTTAAMTGIADQLEDLDFIYRQPSKCDRRKIWLILTESGRIALQDILEA